uniref:Ground-like domain-containing protein n=1 Tax=Syphacia muris TaxID=451379 RepID=A0A0N5AN02_9BILA
MANAIKILLCLTVLIHSSAAGSCCCEPSCMHGPSCPPSIPIVQPCPQPKCPPVICPKMECPLPPICPVMRRPMCPKIKCPSMPMPMPMPCPVVNCPPPPPMNCQKCLPELIFSLPPCSPINCPEPPSCPKTECPAPQPCPVMTCPPQKPCPEAPSKPCSSCSSPSPSLPVPLPPISTMNTQPSLPAQMNMAENIDLDLPAPIQNDAGKTKTVHGCSSPGGCGNNIGNNPFTEDVGEAEEGSRQMHFPKEKLPLDRMKRDINDSRPNNFEIPLTNLMYLQNLDDDIASSKRKVQVAAEEELAGHFNVICSKTEFAYVSHSKIFCQASNSKVTCYAFLALASPHA